MPQSSEMERRLKMGRRRPGSRPGDSEPLRLPELREPLKVAVAVRQRVWGLGGASNTGDSDRRRGNWKLKGGEGGAAALAGRGALGGAGGCAGGTRPCCCCWLR